MTSARKSFASERDDDDDRLRRSSPSAPSGRSSGNVTIKHVADLAGVSPMTVSRVINNQPGVLEGTRARVLQAIKASQYSPNRAARSLAAGSALHIGLLYSNPSAAYLSQFLVGALEDARDSGWHLMIEGCDPSNGRATLGAVRRLVDAQVKGVVLAPPLSESKPILKELAAADVRVVTVAMDPLSGNRLNVRIDDFVAAREMTEHLIELGHRHIGFIKGDPNQTASHEREKGFLTALRNAGLTHDRRQLAQGDFTFRSGLAAAKKLLGERRKITALFASNDDMAAAAISVAHRSGIAVPEQLSVVGFDDAGVATTVWPELTTVRQPVAQMARTALKILSDDLQKRGDGPPVDRVLSHKLIIRESSGPPPA